jgi:hypothetical protein
LDAYPEKRMSCVGGILTISNGKVPNNGFVASVDKHKMKMSISVIVRDEMREVLTTLSSSIDHRIEPDVAEAIVTLRATHLCCKLGFYKVVLKGNAFQVVQALRKECKS